MPFKRSTVATREHQLCSLERDRKSTRLHALPAKQGDKQRARLATGRHPQARKGTMRSVIQGSLETLKQGDATEGERERVNSLSSPAHGLTLGQETVSTRWAPCSLSMGVNCRRGKRKRLNREKTQLEALQTGKEKMRVNNKTMQSE